MKIGELASQSGIPASTIRYYEQKGLLAAAARSTNGYRVYDEQALNRLQLIKFSQSLGFSLDELPIFIGEDGNWNHDKLMQRLVAKQEQTRTAIQALQKTETTLSHLIDILQNTWQQGLCLPQSELSALLCPTAEQRKDRGHDRGQEREQAADVTAINSTPEVNLER